MPLFTGNRLGWGVETVCGPGMLQANKKVFVVTEGGEPVQIVAGTLVVTFCYDEIETIEKEGVLKEGFVDHGIQTGRPFERLAITVKA